MDSLYREIECSFGAVVLALLVNSKATIYCVWNFLMPLTFQVNFKRKRGFVAHLQFISTYYHFIYLSGLELCRTHSRKCCSVLKELSECVGRQAFGF